MNDRIFDRVPMLVVDTATNTYTRYVGTRRTGRWQGSQNLSAHEVEMLRRDPEDFFGKGDSRGAA